MVTDPLFAIPVPRGRFAPFAAPLRDEYGNELGAWVIVCREWNAALRAAQEEHERLRGSMAAAEKAIGDV